MSVKPLSGSTVIEDALFSMGASGAFQEVQSLLQGLEFPSAEAGEVTGRLLHLVGAENVLKLVSAGVYKINAPGLTSAGTLPADVIPSFVAGGLQMLTDLPALGVGECALALVQMNSAVSGIYLQVPAELS